MIPFVPPNNFDSLELWRAGEVQDRSCYLPLSLPRPFIKDRNIYKQQLLVINNNNMKSQTLKQKITLSIDEELWEKFKKTVPRTKSLNDALIELISREVAIR